MANDVKSYIQRVTSRLTEAFELNEFGTEEELYFWSLLSEIASRNQTPNFKEVVQTIDLIFGASVHCVYHGGDGEQLTLFRQMVQSGNIERVYKMIKGEAANSGNEKQFKIEFQEQLQNIEAQLDWRDDFRSPGTMMMNFGKCFYMPLYYEDQIWGIYVVGPYVTCPDRLQPKLAIVGRMLARWLNGMKDESNRDDKRYQLSAEKELGSIGTGSLDTDNLMRLYLGHLSRQLNSIGTAVIGISKIEANVEILSNFQMPKEILEIFNNDPEKGDELEKHLKLPLPASDATAEQQSISHLHAKLLKEELMNHNWYLISGYTSDAVTPDQSHNQDISESLQALVDLLDYRHTHAQFSDKLIKDYEALVRSFEKLSERTYWHTERVKAVALKFAEPLQLEQTETNELSVAARLHDIGYAAGSVLQSIDHMGLDLEHPQLSYDLIEDLPISDEVKQGVLTHHEWIDGSGTPRGATSEDIPWIGKLLGLAEFIVEFLERNQPQGSVEESENEQKITELTDALVERADQQFDMLLVPHAVEIVKSLGWKGCLKLGVDTE